MTSFDISYLVSKNQPILLNMAHRQDCSDHNYGFTWLGMGRLQSYKSCNPAAHSHLKNV